MRAVLMFHHLGEGRGPLAYPRATFESLLNALAASGLPVVDLDTLLDSGAGPGVALTFDDGTRSVLTAALPVLRAAGAPAHLFLCTGFVAGVTPVPDRMPPYPQLAWDDILHLHRSGVAVESHTHRHRDLRMLPSARVEEECARADDEIERRVGRRPRYFAYPFGHHDTEVRRIVAPRYAAAFTTRLAALSGRDDRSRLPRIDAHCLRRQLVYRHLRSPSTRAWLAGRGAVRALRGIP